ncbi:hypothetical protein HYS50_03390 [Candidatus Woesearchaeota archaeon]|nr:hypothetical protein [Candidatus Woesearchaeota archaeon]
MNTEDFIGRLTGTRIPEPGAVERIANELKTKYPNARIVLFNGGVCAESVDYTCMKCGNKLHNVTEMKWDRRALDWVPRKSKGFYHQAVCEHCDKKAIVALAVIQEANYITK